MYVFIDILLYNYYEIFQIFNINKIVFVLKQFHRVLLLVVPLCLVS